MQTAKSTKVCFTKDPRGLYCLEHGSEFHPCQKKLMEETMNYPMCNMMGSPDVMQFCSNLIKLIRGKNILDVGVYTGNSTLAWALSVPDDGKVVSMDISDGAYNDVGKKYVQEAGVAHKVDFRVQEALKTLNELITNGKSGTFDFAFIDADKENYSNYYDKCLNLIRSGGVIAVDNALWRGRVYSEGEKTNDTVAIDALNKKIKSDPRVNGTLLPIGDGLHLAFKK